MTSDTTAANPTICHPNRTTLANLYHLPELPAPGAASLSGNIAHHLARVLRVRVGESVLLGDGRGSTATATITAVQKQLVAVELGEICKAPPLQPALTLAFAVPRPSRADWLVEHATEVGVQSFQPLWTERSRPQGLRADRWRKVATAAAGQCARAWLPEGGFSPQEREAAAAAQFTTVKFGAHILRTETAALVGAGILLRRST